MKNLFLLFSLLIFNYSFSQKEVAYAYIDDGLIADPVFNHQKNAIVKVFVDKTKVRELPTLSSSTIDSLPHNKSLKVIEVTGAINQFGERTAAWIRVSYDNKTGFVWSGNIAIAHHSTAGIDLLFGIPSTVYSKDETGAVNRQLLGSIKYFKNSAHIDEKTFNAGTTENLTAQVFEVKPAYRLKNALYTINSFLSGEACGIPTYEQSYILTSDQLIPLPTTVSIADAGIYYHSEIIEFPSKENKLNNQFWHITEEAETDDNDHSKGTKTSLLYDWNGSTYHVIKTKKETINT